MSDGSEGGTNGFPNGDLAPHRGARMGALAAAFVALAMQASPAHADHFLGPSTDDIYGTAAAVAILALVAGVLAWRVAGAAPIAIPLCVLFMGAVSWFIYQDHEGFIDHPEMYRRYGMFLIAAPVIVLVVGLAGWIMGRRRRG